MLKSIKKYFLIGIASTMLSLGLSNCGILNDSHKVDDKTWLQEQVEKGYMTQEEADAILKKRTTTITQRKHYAITTYCYYKKV